MQPAVSHDSITKAILRSQHCQRNWDLSRQIPDDDLQVLITAATQCPSKQNLAFYGVHFITNRQLIQEIHGYTEGFTISQEPRVTTTNTQTLANLLIVFENKYHVNPVTESRNDETHALLQGRALSPTQSWSLERDAQMAIGIAAGYLNLTASLLGYSTGCCACFDSSAVKHAMAVDGDVALLMGVGFKDESRNRRVHQLDSSFVFPTLAKQDIPVNIMH
jgi:nitroreductase